MFYQIAYVLQYGIKYYSEFSLSVINLYKKSMKLRTLANAVCPISMTQTASLEDTYPDEAYC